MSELTDKILKISLSDFMDFGDNAQNYRDYELVGIFRVLSAYSTNIFSNDLLSIPSFIEKIINLKTGRRSDSDFIILSGTGLVPRGALPNDLPLSYKLLNVSFNDFMNFGNNYERYKEYNIVGINSSLSNTYEASIINSVQESLPPHTEKILDFYVDRISGNNINILSGTALVPKENNKGGMNG